MSDRPYPCTCTDLPDGYVREDRTGVIVHAVKKTAIRKADGEVWRCPEWKRWFNDRRAQRDAENAAKERNMPLVGVDG